MSLARRQPHSITDTDGNELYCVTDKTLAPPLTLRTLPEVEELITAAGLQRLHGYGPERILTSRGMAAHRIKRNYPRVATSHDPKPAIRLKDLTISRQGIVTSGRAVVGAVDLGPWYDGRVSQTQITHEARLAAAMWGLSDEKPLTQS